MLGLQERLELTEFIWKNSSDFQIIGIGDSVLEGLLKDPPGKKISPQIFEDFKAKKKSSVWKIFKFLPNGKLWTIFGCMSKNKLNIFKNLKDPSPLFYSVLKQ